MKIIKGKLEKPQKVIIYGPEGIGKSTFASQFPEPIFIDTEGSTTQLDVARTEAPSSWTMLLQQVDYFLKNPDLCQTLVIDTADWAEKLTIQHICSRYAVDGIEGLGYGKGYTYLEEEFGKFLNKLSELIEKGINVVITAHSKITRFEQPDEIGSYDRWELKLQKKTSPLLKEWADMVLFANYETFIVNVDNQGAAKGKNKAQGGKRVMHTTHTPTWDAKNRHNLQPTLDFDYGAIAHTIYKRNPKEALKTETVAEVKEKYYKHKLLGNYFPMLDGVVQPEDYETLQEISKEEYEKAVAENKDLAQTFEYERNRLEDLKRENNTTWEEAYKLLQGEWKKKKEENKQEAPIKEEEYIPFDDADPLPDSETEKMKEAFGETSEHIPNKKLTDLMISQKVTAQELKEVVASKGYYPLSTPIANYDEGFINGVLVGAWNQVYTQIEKNRQGDK